MLCSGVVCISLSLVSTFVLTTVLQRKSPVELVVSREDRLELQKDVEAAEVLAVVAAVLYMSYLWRTLFKAPAPEPQPPPEDHKEEKQHKEDLFRRPSEHKETQYQASEEAQYVAVKTQTSDCMLPVAWTSSDSLFSNSSLSMMSPPSDPQTETCSLGTIQQPIAHVETNDTSPNYPQTSTAQQLLQNDTTLDSMVQQVLELQVCKALQISEGQQGNPPISNVALPVESPRSETPEKATSPRATDPQLHAITAKPQFPPGAGDFDTPPNPAGDLSPREADPGLRVIHDPAGHSPRKPVTFTVSLASDKSPPRSPERTHSNLPIPKAGCRRRVVCKNCADGSGPSTATVNVTAAQPPSPSARGDGDAQPPRMGSRPPGAGRGIWPPVRTKQPPAHTYTEIHCRQVSPSHRATPPYGCRPPSV